MVDILITGRLVGGHPMTQRTVIDDKTKLPRTQSDGVTPLMQSYIGVAIAKTPGVDWKQTDWGQAMYQAAVAGWPNGEYNSPTFAWKVTDGDSAVPNTSGNKPCDREGYPGHWVVNCQTSIPIKCYHVGKYDPTQQIQNTNEIKPGDYCRVQLNVVANTPSKSPGIYVNPSLFELSRAGVEIILSGGPSAAEAFGGTQAQLPPNAQVSTQVPAPQVQEQQTVVPAPDFLNPQAGAGAVPEPPAPPAPPVEKFNVNGQVFTREALVAAKWTDDMINALPRA